MSLLVPRSHWECMVGDPLLIALTQRRRGVQTLDLLSLIQIENHGAHRCDQLLGPHSSNHPVSLWGLMTHMAGEDC